MGALSFFFFDSNELGCMRTLFFPSGSSANHTSVSAPAEVLNGFFLNLNVCVTYWGCSTVNLSPLRSFFLRIFSAKVITDKRPIFDLSFIVCCVCVCVCLSGVCGWISQFSVRKLDSEWILGIMRAWNWLII